MKLFPLSMLLIMPGTTLAQAGPVGAPGRFIIVHSPHVQRDTVLLDTATGKTWQLAQDTSLEGEPVYWEPMARTDNAAELQDLLRYHPKKAK